MLTRRRMEMALGALWLLDGALQFQPYMFTRDFFSNVLGMANMGLPGPVSRVDFSVTGLLMAHPVAWNTLFASLQVALGVALLAGPRLGGGRPARWALPVSAVWAMALWVIGEGFGGIFMGGASVLNGAPGAAVIYAFAALALWTRGAAPVEGGAAPVEGGPADGGPIEGGPIEGGPVEGGPADEGAVDDRRGAVAASSILGRWAVGAWSAVWAGIALLEVGGPNHLPYVPGAEITDSANGEPAPLAALNHAVGGVVGHHGAAFAVVLGVTAAALALLSLHPALRRPALVVGMVVLSFLGLVGGDLGGMFTGQGTDPGLAPVGILLGLLVWPRRAAGAQMTMAGPAAREESSHGSAGIRGGLARSAGGHSRDAVAFPAG